ncbi:hypothetical protein HYFRA_00011070 [Hymenoscyphus fraxineus]|uniref:Glycosyltransferase family 1 protein n=1 Tax=Hymenoscyphus fraxineus TaxID=746836 RepID=A0A9N9L5C2_9HELO|nr:hypothetical protein HYFRA_00011070 [Hymenoscyphus fraxineus]
MPSNPSGSGGTGSGSGQQADATSIPAHLVAQAQAAILGNIESRHGRRSSRASQHQYGGPSNPTGNTHLHVPQDSATEAPPAYGDRHDEIQMSQDGLDTKANVTSDGRINININQKTKKLSDLLVPALRSQLSLVENEEPLPAGYIPEALGGLPGQTPPPKLNVVIHVVGSRGDVQPFVALGKTLKATYGHRVRLATHPTFQGFVEENGLEFFSIGGDPSELMAFMVKNPGLMPGMDALTSGEVGKRRKGMEEIVLGCWRSCVEAGNGLGAPIPTGSQESLGLDAGINMDTDPSDRPFIADAIIANPPSFAHVHIAEKMGIPLHMMFTMPWSPTQSFPHPLANIQSSNADVNMTNFVSYALVEMMTWQGLGDVINRFRERALGLDPISLIWAPGMLSRLKVPYTYCWSPALIPKPNDWGRHISISGFYFLSLASSYTPAPELAAFLAAGPPPVYIGFGSIVVDDPNAMTTMIFEAVKKTGCRALVSKGWGGLGGDDLSVPEGVFMLGNVPHDWLFHHVSAVVHHGGAGTTAAGIATGKPTVVVPFFGDQPFWGAMVARAGAGPPPIPYKQLTADKLSAALLEALKPETSAKAKELGARIKEEKGTEVGAKSFHDLLDVDSLRCSVAPDRVAVWRLKKTKTRLSALAANVLAAEGLLDFGDLKLYRAREYETDDGPWDPITGGASALIGTIASLSMGVADFPIEIFKKAKTGTDAIKARTNSNKENGEKSPKTSRASTSVDLSERSTPSPPLPGSGAVSPRPPTQSTALSKTSYESTGSSNQLGANASNISSSTVPTTASFTTEPGSISHVSTNATTISAFSRGGSSLKEALRGNRSLSRSLSRDRGTHSRSDSRDPKARLIGGESPPRHSRKNSNTFDPSKMTIENAGKATKGISRIVSAGLKSPMDFTLGIARGFHNAPKLYGDDTVRPQEKVTDFQSGLKAAGKEFGYGFYDGITGLVTQPIRGAEKEGVAGFVKGIGKGIGGVILKPGAAIWGLPGYAFMGVNKEIKKLFGSSVLNYIIAAQTAKGFEDAQACTPEERAEIIQKWNKHKDEYQNMRMKIKEQGPEVTEHGYLSPRGYKQAKHLTPDERKQLHKRLHEDRVAKRREIKINEVITTSKSPFNCPFCRRGHAHRHTPRDLQEMPVVSLVMSHAHTQTETNDVFEQAIHTSVAATSRGNKEEDEMIERAIRASVRELQSGTSSTLDDEALLERAIQASIVETKQSPTAEQDYEHEARLEQAIHESLRSFRQGDSPRGSESEELVSDDDEAVKLAIQLSKEEKPPLPKPEEIDDAILLAIEKSKKEHAPPAASHKYKPSLEDKDLQRVLSESLLEEEKRKNGVGSAGVERRGRTNDSVPRSLVTEESESGSGDVSLTSMNTKADEDPIATAGAKAATKSESGGREGEGMGESKADEEALKLAIEASLRG